MADAKKVSWAQLRIGVMAAVAMAILGVLIFLLTGSGDIFTTYASLYTYMDDAAAMPTGTAVRLNGILVGKVDKIAFSGLKEKGKIVVIKMAVKKNMLGQIPDDSVVGVDAANLLGEKFLNITKGKSATAVKDGGQLKSLEAQDIPQLMSRAGDLFGSFQVSVNRLDALLAGIENGEGTVGLLLKDKALYNELTAAAKEMNKIVATVNSGKGTLGRLLNDEEFYQDIRAPIKRIDAMLNDLQQGQGTMGKLLKDPALFDETRQTIADLRRLVEERRIFKQLT